MKTILIISIALFFGIAVNAQNKPLKPEISNAYAFKGKHSALKPSPPAHYHPVIGIAPVYTPVILYYKPDLSKKKTN